MPRNKALLKKRPGGAAAPKKIVIKPFSKPPTLPSNYYEQTSRDLLDGTMKAIFLPEESNNLSLQNAYTQVVNLVSHQYGPKLYTDLVETLKQACESHVLPAGSFSLETPNLLSFIQTQYQKYVDYLLLCKHVFLPLDRTHVWSSEGAVKRSDATPGKGSSHGTAPSMDEGGSGKLANKPNLSLWHVGLEQFRLRLQFFQLDDGIYGKWWESLQEDWEDSLPLDQQELLQSTLYMWQDLGVLGETLQKKLEPDLIRFFSAKSQHLKDQEPYSAKHVIDYCHTKWIHVAYNWSRFLPKATCVTLLESYLFQPHLDIEWLLNPKNFDPLVEVSAGMLESNIVNSTSTDNKERTQLHHLWMLAGRLTDGYKSVAMALSKFAKTRGLGLISGVGDPKVAKQKIGELLTLQSQLLNVMQSLPHSADHISLKPVWEDVVNPSFENGTNTVAEALAKFVDGLMRDSKKHTGPENQWATRVINGIFCYLQAKDTFEAFYKRDLAKRLLWNKVVSMDVERGFVSLLKAECGAGYTSKMEGMFQDIDWSRETMAIYKQSTAGDSSTSNAGKNQVDTDIHVLTTGYWPVYPQYANLLLPQSLQEPQLKFMDYYKTKYQGRRMTWQYALGHCMVSFKPNGGGRTYDLSVSLCQALVLIQFNDNQDLKITKLMSLVGFDARDEMERILISLSAGKDGTRVLQRRDYRQDEARKSRASVHDEDIFRVNEKFHSKTRKVRITNITMKESKEEREKTVQAVSRDRLYLIDAVLVRIMKARKTILHQQLIPQVLEQVKVPAQPSDIKKRIESLIEREYMERDVNDRSRYNYLA